MLAHGVLAGERVGRAWVIDSNDLRQVEHRRPEVGRPWSPASAWAVLALADGEDPDLSPVERSRARRRLAQGLDVVAGRLSARAELRRFYAHPSVLDRLAAAPAVVRGGISAAAEHGADLVATDGIEGYVRANDLDQLVAKFSLDDEAGRPNVVLRVVDDAAWPFRPGQVVAGRAVVAVDLFESDDPRSRRAGADLLGSE
jgi:hypothetical protein